MKSMLVLSCLWLAAGCATAQAQSDQAPAVTTQDAGLSPQSSADEILDALHEIGTDLRDLSADVTQTETDGDLGESYSRSGYVRYQRQGDGDARMRFTLNTKTLGGRTVQEKLEYLLDDGWLIDRNYDKKIEVKRQVLRPGEKINLLKLGEGPFPLPIGQPKEEVHRLFEVTKIEPKPNDPPDTVHVLLEPRPGTQFAEKIKSLDVWIGTESNMPRRLESVDVNESTIRTWDMEDVKVNSGLADAAFRLDPVDPEEWSLPTEPFSR